MALSLFQYIIASYILVLPILVNLFAWQSSLFSKIFGGIFLVFQLLVLAQYIKKTAPTWVRLISAFFILFLMFGTIQTTLYLAANLSQPVQALSFLLFPAILAIFIHRLERTRSAEPIHFQMPSLPGKKETLFITFSWIFTLITIFIQLINGVTTDVLRSPWNALHPEFWLAYLILTLLVFIASFRLKPTLLTYLITASHLFVSTAIAATLYKIGYGFDPFLHQAAEQTIIQSGVVLPKTPYYIGQYSLIAGIHNLLGLSVTFVDRWLVPTLFALSLPLTLFFFDQKRTPLWLASLVLILPYASFISSTPQSLANLLFLWVLFLSVPILRSDKQQTGLLIILWLCSFLAFFTHPISGIPALLISLALTLLPRLSTWRRPARLLTVAIFAIGSTLATPLAFLFNAQKGGLLTDLHWQFASLRESLLWLPIWPSSWIAPSRDIFAQFGYFLGQASILLVIVLALLSLLWLLDRGQRRLAYFYGSLSLILTISAILLAGFVPFEVITYERLDYPRRVFYLAQLSLLPLLMLGAIWLRQKLAQAPKSIQIFLFIFLSLLLTGTLFVSYPRSNQAEIGRQYNVREADLETVKTLPPDGSFIVLANQSLSAAAIKEYGFAQYFALSNGETAFFYSVPTSGSLYAAYLDMVYDTPSREHAKMAADLAGVNTVYLIISDYWNNAEQLMKLAAKEADEMNETAGGQNVIFRYHFE